MNEVQLSNRLREVVIEVPKGAKIADIGSDHAYLPCYAILNDIASYAIAGEVVEGPYQSACAQVKRCGLTEQIEVRKGNGLAVIAPNEVEAITIAGMGGALIRDILENGKEKLAGIKRLILQPNIAAHNIRQWLIENDWTLIKEKILEEDGKVYEILIAERGNGLTPYSDNKEKELLFGPLLLKEKNDAFMKKWRGELTNLKRVYEQITKGAQTEEAMARKTEIEERMKFIEEVL
ncbi:MAG: tRNA (adenine(22)-N(1))-methyltransferase [Bacillaceae bacterium]